MRDLGYSLETAVADLIDNSISANATSIDIVCELAAGRPYLAILDNGRGMSPDELIAAMRVLLEGEGAATGPSPSR